MSPIATPNAQEYLAIELALLLRLPALVDGDTRRMGIASCGERVGRDSPIDRPDVLNSTETTLSRFRWLMTAGPTPVVTDATWPNGARRRRAVRPVNRRGQLAQVGRAGARLRREPDVDVAHLAAGSCQSPALMPANAGPQRLRDLTHGHADAPRDTAIEIDRQLRLLSLGRETDVHGARHGLDRLQRLSAYAASSSVLLPRAWSCTCFRPPPQSVANTAIFAPPTVLSSSRSCAEIPRH
jgi:hypothetical protein